MEAREIPRFTERDIINPYPNQTPQALLGRPVKVFSGPFAQNINTTLLTTWETANAKTLDTFEYYRCDFRLRLLLRTSATAYGWVMAAWKYGFSKGQPPIPEPQFMATMDSAFIDVSSSTAVEFEVPFVYPAPYFRKANGVGSYIQLWTEPGETADISTGSRQVDLEIWVEAYNIDVGGYVQPQADKGTVGGRMAGFLNTASQMAPVAAAVAGMYNRESSAQEESQTARSGRVENNPIETMADGVAEENAASGIKIAMYGNLNTIKPARQIATLGEFVPADVGVNGSCTLLSDLVTLPGLPLTAAFVAPGFSDIPLRLFGPYGRLISNYFRYYRGTHRVGLHFYTHPLLSGRFTVQIFYEGTSSDVTSTAVPTMNFLIKGSETKVIDVPYHRSTAVMPTLPLAEATIATMRVTMTHAPTAFATGVTPFIYLAVSVSGTEDAQFFSIRASPGNDLPIPPAMVEAQSLRKIHKVQGESLVAASTTQVPWYPEITTVEQLCQRWFAREIRNEASNQFRYDIIPYGFTTEVEIPEVDIMYGIPYDVFSTVFALSRASLEVKVALDPIVVPPAQQIASVAMTNGTPTSHGLRNAFDPGNGVHLTNVPQQSVVEYRAPFLSPYRALNRQLILNTPIVGVNNIEGVSHNFDDFTASPTQLPVYARTCTDVQFTHVNCVQFYRYKPPFTA